MSRRLLPREKALRFGISTLEDYELLALILSVGSGKADVFTLARTLLDSFSLKEMANLPVKALMQIEGIGEAKAVRLVAAFEIGRRMYLPPEGTLNHEHVKSLLAELSKSRKEKMMIAMYDAAGRFLGSEVVAVGSLNVLYVHMREVFDPLFRMGATRFIVAHNHPDGTLEPSSEDINFIRKLKRMAEELEFALVESFVVGRRRAFGMLGGMIIDLP